MNFSQIGEQFVDAYFSTWNPKFNEGGQIVEVTRQHLHELYTPESLLTMQQNEIVGADDIMRYLTRDDLQGVLKQKEFVNCQPTVGGAILVLVQGAMKMTPAEQQTIPFSEIFIILPTPNGKVLIMNQVMTTHSF